jgi:hypothetical protein
MRSSTFACISRRRRGKFTSRPRSRCSSATFHGNSPPRLREMSAVVPQVASSFDSAWPCSDIDADTAALSSKAFIMKRRSFSYRPYRIISRGLISPSSGFFCLEPQCGLRRISTKGMRNQPTDVANFLKAIERRDTDQFGHSSEDRA